jgi:hypothetical protein
MELILTYIKLRIIKTRKMYYHSSIVRETSGDDNTQSEPFQEDQRGGI